jgi:hypothetical protein
VAYPLQNALFQWEQGARRLRDADTREASTFTAEELANHYGEDTGWADDLAGMESWIVDAAFHRYLREAQNYAGGGVRS